MTDLNKTFFVFKIVLLGLFFLSLGIPVLTILALFAYTPEDYVFSLVVVILTILFIAFQMIMVIINIKKPLAIYRIGFTDRGLVNPIPLIAVVMGLIIGLSLSLLGIILFFIKVDPVIKCNSLVILSIGFYLLINCVFYIIFILFCKKRIINTQN